MQLEEDTKIGFSDSLMDGFNAVPQAVFFLCLEKVNTIKLLNYRFVERSEQMEKDQLLKDLREQGTSFHMYRAMVSDSAEQKLIESARQLEQDRIITLDVCKVTSLDGSPMVEIKGQFI